MASSPFLEDCLDLEVRSVRESDFVDFGGFLPFKSLPLGEYYQSLDPHCSWVGRWNDRDH